MLTSEQLYQELQAQFQQARAQLPGQDPHMIIWADAERLKIDLTIGNWSNDELKVSGKHLGELTEELARRIGFKARQDQLQLAAPEIVQGDS